MARGYGAWVWRVGMARGVHEVHAEIWAPFPRMARGLGAPRGRRVERVPFLRSNTTEKDLMERDTGKGMSTDEDLLIKRILSNKVTRQGNFCEVGRKLFTFTV